MKLLSPEGSLRTLGYGSIGRTALEAVLALATGLLLARLAWVAASSGQQVGDMRPANLPTLSDIRPGASSLAMLTQTDPFLNKAIDTSQIIVPTSLNLTIAGLRWSDGEARDSSAVLVLPDRTQKRFTIGEQIVSGATLEAVAADRVFLRHNGQLQELLLKDPNKPLFGPSSTSGSEAPSQVAAAPAPNAQEQTAAATQAGVTPSLLISDIDLTPELRNGAVSGYRISSRGQGHFEAAGLENGDLVLRINGNSIEGMGPEAIQAAVMTSDTIALDVVRSGAIVRLRISPESGLSQ